MSVAVLRRNSVKVPAPPKPLGDPAHAHRRATRLRSTALDVFPFDAALLNPTASTLERMSTNTKAPTCTYAQRPRHHHNRHRVTLGRELAAKLDRKMMAVGEPFSRDESEDLERARVAEGNRQLREKNRRLEEQRRR